MVQKNNKDIQEEILDNEEILEENQPEDPTELEEEILEQESEKEKTIADLGSKLEESEQSFLRLQADFDNFKKRSAKEKQEIHKYAAENILKNILPVIDNFERALDSIKKNQEANQGYIQGIEMVYQQMIDVLKNEGLEEIPAVGEEFDPNLHHAVAQESSEGLEDNHIIEVFQKGYRMKDKVIRPSMVKVCIH